MVTSYSFQRLFFPDTAYFGFPLPLTNGRWQFGSALPIHPHCAVGIVPKEYHREWIRKLFGSPGMLRTYSIGLGGTGRIVIHPDELTEAESEMSLVQQLRAIRERNLNRGWTVEGDDGKHHSIIELLKNRFARSGTAKSI